MNFLWPGCQQYIGLRRQKIAFGSTLLSPVLCPWRHSRSLGCENEVLNLSLCCLTSEDFGDNHFGSSPLYYGWDVTFNFSSIYERKFHINITSFNAGQISTVNPISKILLFMFYIFYWHFIIPKNIFHDFSFGKLHAMNMTSGGSQMEDWIIESQKNSYIAWWWWITCPHDFIFTFNRSRVLMLMVKNISH